MTIDPMALLKVLGEASGWVVCVFLLIMFVWGFSQEWWVPGRIYKREVERGDLDATALRSATEANERGVKANADLARAYEDMADMLYEDAPAPRRRPRRRRTRLDLEEEK